MKAHLVFIIILSFFTLSSCSSQDKTEGIDMKYRGQVNAPEFPKGLEWLNTEKELSIKDLKGKIILLDFWTYCCINCIHVIPDLKKLERKFPNELVVIGVHSAKFKNEKEAQNIRNAILRYDLEHPVVNDKNFEIWNEYTIRSWPSFVLINPIGKVVAMTSGEGVYARLNEMISEMANEFDKAGLLNKESMHFRLEKEKAPAEKLSFPGKIAGNESAGLIYFTDSNNNRIVIANSDGKIIDIIGSGKIGQKDGDYQTAEFFRPQGIAFDSAHNLLYIADTENHLIRKIDLNKKTVETIAGTGKQAKGYYSEGGIGRSAELNSPWDLVLVENNLYIAMAGPHQIWKMNLNTNLLSPYAGNGQEDIIDGNLKNSSFAQPSGITYGDGKLYTTDSETSSIREINLEKGTVKTLIGQGLFDFGDIDGEYPKARLQHCIGLSYFKNKLYIADTYNHKIKVYDLSTKKIETLIGTGISGNTTGSANQAALNEPNDVIVMKGALLIVDTNNNEIKRYDFKSDKVEKVDIH